MLKQQQYPQQMPSYVAGHGLLSRPSAAAAPAPSAHQYEELSFGGGASASAPGLHYCAERREEDREEELMQVSVQTLLGVAQMLGHHIEDRSPIAMQQDLRMLRQLHAETSTQLRDSSQRHIFTVAPLVSAQAAWAVPEWSERVR
jgi:hypothetical protein